MKVLSARLLEIILKQILRSLMAFSISSYSSNLPLRHHSKNDLTTVFRRFVNTSAKANFFFVLMVAFSISLQSYHLPLRQLSNNNLMKISIRLVIPRKSKLNNFFFLLAVAFSISLQRHNLQLRQLSKNDLKKISESPRKS
jgi:hypothetical protein